MVALTQPSSSANQLVMNSQSRLFDGSGISNIINAVSSGVANVGNSFLSGVGGVVNSASNVVTAVNPASIVHSAANIPGLAGAAASVINPMSGLSGGGQGSGLLGGLLGGNGSFLDTNNTTNTDTQSSKTMIYAGIGAVVLVIIVWMFKKK